MPGFVDDVDHVSDVLVGLGHFFGDRGRACRHHDHAAGFELLEDLQALCLALRVAAAPPPARAVARRPERLAIRASVPASTYE